ncbi:hypothetical protein PINS_up022626 [Pythium insidiosum]|nr:hypothetical protein PINS_up022626 [Pythium insidiosum]
MASGGIRRDHRPAEAGSDTESERLYADRVVPGSHPEQDWDTYTMRKHSVGSQPVLGVLRNDRTPLNTPYTPQLVKLQLRRHEEHEEHNAPATTPASAVVATIRASVLHLLQPFRHVRSGVDHVVSRVLPSRVERSALFRRHRSWVVSYLTTVLCIPFVMLLSPMVIAFCICTSPIWIAGVVVLAIRSFMPFWRHTPMPEEFTHSPNSHLRRANGTHQRMNGHSSAATGYKRSIASRPASADG